jgi:hypothetical protein
MQSPNVFVSTLLAASQTMLVALFVGYKNSTYEKYPIPIPM